MTKKDDKQDMPEAEGELDLATLNLDNLDFDNLDFDNLDLDKLDLSDAHLSQVDPDELAELLLAQKLRMTKKQMGVGSETLKTEALKNADPEMSVRGRPFRKGQSGNPAGRPKGAFGKKTLAARALIEENIEGLTREGLKRAMDGDNSMLRHFMKHAFTYREERTAHIDVPPLTSVFACEEAEAKIAQAAFAGDISTLEADSFNALLERRKRCFAFPERVNPGNRGDEYIEEKLSKIFDELVAKYPGGTSESEDKRQDGSAFQEICERQLRPYQEMRLFQRYKSFIRWRAYKRAIIEEANSEFASSNDNDDASRN